MHKILVTAVLAMLVSFMATTSQAAQGPNPEVLNLAMKAIACGVASGDLKAPPTLTLIDYSLPSTEPRLWVFDLHTGKTLFHELVHSTGHPRRLGRFTEDSPPPPFGSPDYSREELVAELGAAFLCAETGISNATLDNSAAYLAGWLRVLKIDRKAVVLAAGGASKAATLIAGAQSS